MRWLIAVSCLLALGTSFAASDEELLPAEQAFVVEARALDASTVAARWIIADGYYLYRDRITFESETPAYRLGTPDYPAGKIKEDPYFGRMETYRHEVVVKLPVERLASSDADLVLIAHSQGCADLGVCYPPQERRIKVHLPLPQHSDSAQPAARNLATN